MNFSFTIELVEFGKKCHIYTIRIDGEEYNEFDKFLLDDKIQAHPEFESLMVRISSIAHKIGAQDQFFKLHESTSTEAIVALWRKDLRLYCCRHGNIILILGGGGLKKSRTYQEDKHLNHCVDVLKYVSKRLDKRINEGDIKYDNKYRFNGNLKFDKEDI